MREQVTGDVVDSIGSPNTITPTLSSSNESQRIESSSKISLPDIIDDSNTQSLPSFPNSPGAGAVVDSEDGSHVDLVNKLNINKLHHFEDTTKRLMARLQSLSSRIEAKDVMIVRLQSRIEEVKVERDSFKEAMTMSFQDSSYSPSHYDNNTATPPHNGSNVNQSVSAAGGLLSSIATGVNKYRTGVQATGSVPPLNQNNSVQLANLQEQFNALVIKNLELKHIEKIQPQLLEYEARASKAEEALIDIENRSNYEIDSLNAQIEKTQSENFLLLEQLKVTLEDVDSLKRQNAKHTYKITSLESKQVKLQDLISSLEKQLSDAMSKIINPKVINDLEQKISDLQSKFYFHN